MNNIDELLAENKSLKFKLGYEQFRSAEKDILFDVVLDHYLDLNFRNEKGVVFDHGRCPQEAKGVWWERCRDEDCDMSACWERWFVEEANRRMEGRKI